MSLTRRTLTGKNFIERLNTTADASDLFNPIHFYQKFLGSEGASGNTLFTVTQAFIPNEHTLWVFLNGQKLEEVGSSPTGLTQYEEVGNNQFRLGAGAANNDILEVMIVGGPIIEPVDITGQNHSLLNDDEPQKHYLVGSINHSAINDNEATKHRLINDGSTSTIVLWSANKINAMIAAIPTTPPASSVGQAQLKTSTQEQSQTIGALSGNQFTLTGGQYCFYPQTKGTNNAPGDISIANNVGISYATKVYIFNPDNFNSEKYYVKQRYVTASGEINWLFILRDKTTKEMIGISFAVDHPCFGNGGIPEEIPHPFLDYDPKNEIILINPSNEDVAEWGKDIRGIPDIIIEDYEIDDSVNPDWPDTPVTIGLPTDSENLPWGTPIEPIKKVIPQSDDVTTALLKLKS